MQMMFKKRATGKETTDEPYQSTPSLFVSNVYENSILRARVESKPDVLDNRSSSHASVVIRELIEFARETNNPIRMVIGELHPACYYPISDCLEKYLDSYSSTNNNISIKLIRLFDVSSGFEYISERGGY